MLQPKLNALILSAMTVLMSHAAFAVDEQQQAEQPKDDAYAAAYNSCSAQADASLEVPFEVVFARCMNKEGFDDDAINQINGSSEEPVDAQY